MGVADEVASGVEVPAKDGQGLVVQHHVVLVPALHPDQPAKAGLVVELVEPERGALADDLLDALIACRTAARHAQDADGRLPATPPLGPTGLLMEMWR